MQVKRLDCFETCFCPNTSATSFTLIVSVCSFASINHYNVQCKVYFGSALCLSVLPRAAGRGRELHRVPSAWTRTRTLAGAERTPLWCCGPWIDVWAVTSKSALRPQHQSDTHKWGNCTLCLPPWLLQTVQYSIFIHFSLHWRLGDMAYTLIMFSLVMLSTSDSTSFLGNKTTYTHFTCWYFHIKDK